MRSLLRVVVASSVLVLHSIVAFAQWTGGSVPQWTQVDTLRNEHIRVLTSGPLGYLYMGTKDHGLWRSTDQGASWTQRLSPPSVYEVWSISADRLGNLYAGTHFAGVYRSTDNGDSWDQIVTSGNIDYLSIAVTDSGTILAADAASSAPITRSTDNGASWNPSWGATYVTALATNESFNPNTCTCYAGSSYGYVYYSTNEGDSWSWTSAGRLGSGGTVCSFVVMSIANVFAATSSAGVFFSGDCGATWEPRNAGLAAYFTGYSNYINWLGNDYASTSQPFLLLGTCKGAFWFNYSGGTWTSAGLDSMNVLSMANSVSGNLFAGTDGNGLWFTGDRPTAIAEPSRGQVPADYSLAQNWPNPCNPSTNISYSVACSKALGEGGTGGRGDGEMNGKAVQVRLAVYDLLGREVAVLVDGRQMPGEHRVVFNGSTLASGVYFYRLTAEGQTLTKRLVLMK